MLPVTEEPSLAAVPELLTPIQAELVEEKNAKLVLDSASRGVYFEDSEPRM